MDEQKLIRLQEFLASHGQDINTISKSRLKQFSLVDEMIQKKISQITEAKETLKNCTINVSTIASETKISRKTFYNNELLKLYVESFSDIAEENTTTETDLKNLKEKYDLLSNQLKSLLIRDIDIENLRQENAQLAGEIKNVQNHNAALEKKIEELLIELSNARKNIVENNLRLVDFSAK